MLEPKKQKYRQTFRGKRRGKAHRGSTLEFGEYGLKAKECGWVSANQIEAARKAIRHYTKRSGRIWIRVFPDKPITKKPPEVRMGRGKGPFDHFAVVIKPGKILFEIAGVESEMAAEAMRRASHKLSIQTRFISREKAE